MSKYDQQNLLNPDTIPGSAYLSPQPKKQSLQNHSASTLFPPNSSRSPVMPDFEPFLTLRAFREPIVRPVEMKLFFTPERQPAIIIGDSPGIITKPIIFSPLPSQSPQPEVGDMHGEDGENSPIEAVESRMPIPNGQGCGEPQASSNEHLPNIVVLFPPAQKQAASGMTCNCKKTKCLRMYCDCFRNNKMCEGCNCQDCHNDEEHRFERDNAMLTLLDRNPEAFRPKIQSEKHSKGCNCRLSECMKKYCECFQAGVPCGERCKCEQCKNHKHREPKRQRTGLKKDGGYISWSRRRN